MFAWAEVKAAKVIKSSNRDIHLSRWLSHQSIEFSLQIATQSPGQMTAASLSTTHVRKPCPRFGLDLMGFFKLGRFRAEWWNSVLVTPIS